MFRRGLAAGSDKATADHFTTSWAGGGWIDIAGIVANESAVVEGCQFDSQPGRRPSALGRRIEEPQVAVVENLLGTLNPRRRRTGVAAAAAPCYAPSMSSNGA